MEELQDAIEDAQYMNAMHDDTPKPTKAWVFPSEEQLREFMDAIAAKDPEDTSAERMCSTPLGLYLVSLPRASSRANCCVGASWVTGWWLAARCVVGVCRASSSRASVGRTVTRCRRSSSSTSRRLR